MTDGGDDCNGDQANHDENDKIFPSKLHEIHLNCGAEISFVIGGLLTPNLPFIFRDVKLKPELSDFSRRGVPNS